MRNVLPFAALPLIAALVLPAGPATAATPTVAPPEPASASPSPTASVTASPTASATAPPSASPTGSPTGVPPATAAVLTVPATLTVPGKRTRIPWPKVGRARLEVAGVGLVGRSGNLRPAPIASVTKVMTAYTILRDHPLAAGQDGPRIRVLRSEAAAYARRRAAGESLVKVSASRPVTERQALQALLIASGNNMADILARWDAGSTRAFVRRMNADAALLGMTSTHYADASGLNPASRSTTADLVRLARAAMAGDTFAAIVRQQRASIPLNQLRNTNKLLGRHGIIGIKTGSTRAAGGCLLFAAHRVVGGRVYTVYGALLGAPGPKILTHALAASDALVVAARAALVPATVLRAGQRVATVRKADGTVVSLALGRNLDVVGWAGQTYRLSLPRGLPPGQVPTTLTARTPARTLTVPLVTAT